MSQPTPAADKVGLREEFAAKDDQPQLQMHTEAINQSSTLITKSTPVKRHQRIPYAQKAHPYPDPSNKETFKRASSAVLKTLSWPQKQFTKWIEADIKRSVQAAENDLAALNDPFQVSNCLQSQTSTHTSATMEAPAPPEIGVFPETCQTANSHDHTSLESRSLVERDCKPIYNNSTGPPVHEKKLCPRYSSTGTNPYHLARNVTGFVRLTILLWQVPAHSAQDATAFTMMTKFPCALLFYVVRTALQENTAISATSLPQKDRQHARFISREDVLGLTVSTAMRLLTRTCHYVPILLTLDIVNKD